MFKVKIYVGKGQLMVLVTLKWQPGGLLDKLPPSHSLCLLACASAGGGGLV